MSQETPATREPGGAYRYEVSKGLAPSEPLWVKVAPVRYYYSATGMHTIPLIVREGRHAGRVVTVAYGDRDVRALAGPVLEYKVLEAWLDCGCSGDTPLAAWCSSGSSVYAVVRAVDPPQKPEEAYRPPVVLDDEGKDVGGCARKTIKLRFAAPPSELPSSSYCPTCWSVQSFLKTSLDGKQRNVCCRCGKPEPEICWGCNRELVRAWAPGGGIRMRCPICDGDAEATYLGAED